MEKWQILSKLFNKDKNENLEEETKVLIQKWEEIEDSNEDNWDIKVIL